ncbi:MAG: pyrroloquinoline quinone biosynthesis protein PqqB [Pseudomonadota bacterium]|jgi:pyrroloquinoline quinone biosynthesis protein B|uniref:pyrroloquinoline quinone biosynthesis protein PqqB n=1 Tax=Methylophaga TaxID=40222 RepID=UPI0017645A7C|nr:MULTISPECIES: pyrroloquinoline quinone biosynthesis protein PqqB [Methylophaga]MEC9411371.1 pyrroloquinoline quinone biosynthesis protein PqqB [Pseudomonadota bacterium]WVI84980.1 pyrroloquinoline quinone biosynthesis protein PqqB [Methylophaga thalassica]HIC46716.1 pyrroloquinoline quinone biosynthesis protein PqqB [Methylophaga sp.]HIM39437.1 pyrroloquinoline quinone biosynthesis protein PqqB [Methylophaga aminisulfidivorans]
MFVHVLGSGAGGGFPQWNCNCTNCKGVREGTIKASPRTQSSIAISANGTDWILFNASPDIKKQLDDFPALQPARQVRDTAISAIVITDAQIDHVTGMLTLREHNKPWDVYTTKAVYEDLTTGFPVFNILGHFRGINHHEIATDESSFTIPTAEGLVFTAVPLKSEAPPYSPHRHNTVPGDNIGMRIEDTRTGKNLFYAPGLGVAEPHVMEYMANADMVLVDGTVWTDDEMSHEGISNKRAQEMGHLDQSSKGGIMEILSGMDKPRKFLIHINNTNPILNEESPQRKTLEAAGIEVSYDGMDIEL